MEFATYQITPEQNGNGTYFLQIADTGCSLSEMRWHIMDVYVRVACIMERIRHCTFVVQKRQINILVKQEYQYSEVILHRLIIIT